MATTARDIVTAAMRRAQILQKGEDAPAEDAAEALGQLNRMMHGWKAYGADIEHTDLTLSDDFTLSAEFHEGAEFLLASRIAINNGRPAPTADGFDVDNWWRALQAAYWTKAKLGIDSGLKRMPSQFWGHSRVRS